MSSQAPIKVDELWCRVRCDSKAGAEGGGWDELERLIAATHGTEARHKIARQSSILRKYE